jgi:hypothetical protein
VLVFLIFKLEEVSAALLLHLPKLFAETTVFSLAAGLGCGLVVGTVQATDSIILVEAISTSFTKKGNIEQTSVALPLPPYPL